MLIQGRNTAGINVNRNKMENEQKLNTKWTEMEWFFLVDENIQVVLISG